jgi:hypothetical protein
LLVPSFVCFACRYKDFSLAQEKHKITKFHVWHFYSFSFCLRCFTSYTLHMKQIQIDSKRKKNQVNK